MVLIRTGVSEEPGLAAKVTTDAVFKLTVFHDVTLLSPWLAMGTSGRHSFFYRKKMV